MIPHLLRLVPSTLSVLLASACATDASAVYMERSAVQDEAEARGEAVGEQTLNVFVGGNTEFSRARSFTAAREGFALGLDYEYRVAPRWGLGGFADGLAGTDRSFVTGFQAYWHVVSDLILIAGPGVERHHDEWAPIVRVGAAYEFELESGYLLSPCLFYDFTQHENVLVYGLNFGTVW